jgi:ParB family transcriptional regulator, chromosome partitioning protein
MVNHVKIADIDANAEGRLRPVDRDHSEFLAISIKEIGVEHPIVVRPTPDATKPYQLVIGGHRLDAFSMLGWTELEVGKHVVIREMSDDQAKLAEIDENLARHELNALDRALHLQERKRIYEAIYPETAHGKARKSGKTQTLGLFRESFSRQAAKKIGLSKSAVELAVKLASDLDPDAIKALRGTKIERNQKELLAIAALDPEQQRTVAGLIGAGAAKTSQQAKITAGLAEATAPDPQGRLYAALVEAWNKADKVTRASFLETAGLIYAPADAPAKGGKK